MTMVPAPSNRETRMNPTRRACTQCIALITLLGACAGGSQPALAENVAMQKHPDVVAVQVRPRAADSFDFDVTVSSPYDTPRRYADAFRVTDAGGRVFGERILLHDHANEQPFTRDLHGVRIAPEVRTVNVQARDMQHGYGGKSMSVRLPGR